MARLGRKGWAGALFGVGGSAMIALVAAPELPAWSVLALAGTGGLAFSTAAYLLGVFRAPIRVGAPVRATIVLVIIWTPIAFLTYKEYPRPSFPFIHPAVVLNPDAPDAYWVLFVVIRGRNELHNVDVAFQDMIRSGQVRELLEKGGVSPEQARQLFQSESIRLHYDELRRNTLGGNQNESAQFYWRPPIMSDERYDILFQHRKGTVREELAIKQVD